MFGEKYNEMRLAAYKSASSSPLLMASEFLVSGNIKSSKSSELKFLLNLSSHLNWEPNAELNKIKLPYMAVVVTDIDKNIIWVNGYFEIMTGYSKNEVLNKNPKFLQGKATDTLTLHTIRKKINGQKKFKGTLINYKKNGEEYRCNVDIQPIFNLEGYHSHYIAFETDR
jgi:PAS domain S-box-containing protein